METRPPCAVLTDGLAGNRRQALALAGALSLPVDERTVRPPPPWRWLAPRRLPGTVPALGTGMRTLRDMPPALAIGCGRQAALATRLLQGRCPTVQILDPRLDLRHWDHIVVPEHDGLHGSNVITLVGSLHPVDADWLATQRLQTPAFGRSPSPRTAVFIGGPTAAAPWDIKLLESLITQLRRRVLAEGGTLWVTGSRRTPPRMRRMLRAALQHHASLWFDETDGPNPYTAQLAWAERIVVTPDSANLLSEACATDAPVFVAFPGLASGRIGQLVGQLRDRDRARPLGATLAAWPITPLRETARVAAALRQRLGDSPSSAASPAETAQA